VDRTIWTPAHTSRALTVFTEQAKTHIDLRQTNVHIRFVFEIYACQRSTGADLRAADAVFPAVVLIKG
jgi:hypothetical protein